MLRARTPAAQCRSDSLVAPNEFLLCPGRTAKRLAAAAHVRAGQYLDWPVDSAARLVECGISKRRLIMAGGLSAPSPQGWIISRRDDLLWFQGSVAAGVALLVFFRLAPHLDDASYTPGHLAVLALFLWGVLFDGTHVWGTYARSYFAPDAA